MSRRPKHNPEGVTSLTQIETQDSDELISKQTTRKAKTKHWKSDDKQRLIPESSCSCSENKVLETNCSCTEELWDTHSCNTGHWETIVCDNTGTIPSNNCNIELCVPESDTDKLVDNCESVRESRSLLNDLDAGDNHIKTRHGSLNGSKYGRNQKIIGSVRSIGTKSEAIDTECCTFEDVNRNDICCNSCRCQSEVFSFQSGCTDINDNENSLCCSQSHAKSENKKTTTSRTSPLTECKKFSEIDANLPPQISEHFARFASLNMNLSLCGCGFLGIYHLGVAKTLTTNGRKLLLNTQKYIGASAGALVAATLAIKGCDRKAIEDAVSFTYNLAEFVHSKKLGLLTPKLDISKNLSEFLNEMIPENGHEIASGRLYISLTTTKKPKNVLVSNFNSKDHLIKCLLGTSYVPYITGSKSVEIDGKRYMDGGITDNLPQLPDSRTITISPFSGKQDICPRDSKSRDWFININNQDFQVNAVNILRGIHAFKPPSIKKLERYYRMGVSDATKFLKKEGFYEEDEEESKHMEEYKFLRFEES